MEKNFNVFYCTVCHLCKTFPKSSKASKFCSGCKLVCYCCDVHQKNDWTNHKKFCRVIQFIVKRAESDHIYSEISQVTQQQSVHWNTLRMSVVRLVELLEKRPLTPIESQILLFPPVCNLCFGYKSNKMFPCERCKTVIYCSVDHQANDEHHKISCKVLSLSFEIDMLRCSKNEVVFNFEESAKRFKDIIELTKDMESLLLTYRGNALLKEDILQSEPLSFTLSLIFVISKITKTTANTLTVHIVGADDMEVLAIQTLPFVYHLSPHLKHLNIIMIGPNLSETITVSCGESVFSTRTYKMTYHEYFMDESFLRPDIIAVFNCGFCEFASVPEKDLWKNSLPCFLSFNACTVILTSYTSIEAKSDLKRLCESNESDVVYDVLVDIEINPFGSLYSHRDWEMGTDHDGVFYVNKYISVLKT